MCVRVRVCVCGRACVRAYACVRRGAGLIVLCTITTYCTMYKKPKKSGKGGRNAPPTPFLKAVSATGVDLVRPIYNPQPPYI
jgi:hypothetical protein